MFDSSCSDAVCVYRVREAIKGKVAVVDVDGSYLVRKHEQLRQAGVNVAPLGLPLSGWITINEANYKDESQKIPRMLPGTSTSPATPASLSLSPNHALHMCMYVPVST